MFGANEFGEPYFGEEFVQTIIPLDADSTIAFATTTTISAPVNFFINSTVSFLTDTSLTARTRFVADSTISFSTSTFLGIFGYLEGDSEFTFSTDGVTLFLPRPLNSDSTIPFSVISPRLEVGSITFNSDSSFNFSAQAFLTAPPVLLGNSTFAFSSEANLTDIGVGAFTTQFTINSVHVESRVRFDSITINDILNEEPNHLSFKIDGTAPTVGQDVKVGLLNLATSNLLFGGTIIDVTKSYESTIGNVVWQVNCSDYTFLLNRRKVWEQFTNVSATTIVLNLMTKYSSGFTTVNVAGGLPTITVSFDGSDLSAALTQIDTLAGTYHYIDYARDLHVFVSEATDTPDPVDTTNTASLIDPPLSIDSDLQQVRNKVYVKGHSATVVTPSGFAIPPNSPMLPVDDVTSFSSGQAFISPENFIINYSGVSAGGTTASVVSSVTAGTVPAAPSPALLSGVAGRLSGTYRWAISFGNSSGESALSPTSVPLACPDVNVPTSAPGVGATGTVGPLTGSYSYAITNVTTLGETTVGPAANRTAVALASPGAPAPTSASGAGGLLVGNTYNYRVSFVTQYGETAAGNAGSFIPPAFSQPALTINSAPGFGLLVGPSGYTYGISFVTQYGESTPPSTFTVNGPFSTSAPPSSLNWTGTQDTAGRILPGNTYVWAASFYSLKYGETALGPGFSLSVGGSVPVRLLMNVPIALPTNADGIRVYRGLAGGNPFFLDADFRRGNMSNFGFTYFDAAAQSELQNNPFPVSPLFCGQQLILNVLASGEIGVLARRIYRSINGGSDLFLIGEIQNNVGTTFTDNVPDSSLIQRNPVAQATGRQCQVTGIQTGPTGVIGRRVYRTKANGSTYYLVADIRDNTTTSFIDNQFDSTLSGSTAPGASTAGGDTHQISSIPTGPAGTLARKIYRTAPGGSEFRLIGQLSNNTSTTFVDNVPDTSLGPTAPLVSTAGSSAVRLTIQTGGVGVTQRIIYRTPANNSTDFKYVGVVNDNTSTTYDDTAADSNLGRLPPPLATIGIFPGETSMILSPSATGFPTAGWVKADSQLIFHSGITGNTLTGIPPIIIISSITTGGTTTATVTTSSPHGFSTGNSIGVFGANEQQFNGPHTITVTGASTFTYTVPTGTPNSATGNPIKVSLPGSITGTLTGGTSVVAVPGLTGLSGLTQAVFSGDSVSLWVVVNDLTSQASIAASEGGDGIHEAIVEDSELMDVTACTKRGNAELTLFSLPLVTLSYATRDKKTRSGKTIAVNLPPPLNIVTSLKIMDVTIDQFALKHSFPRFRVNKASNAKFSISDLIRHVVLST